MIGTKQQRTILIVDDTPINIRVLAQTLKSMYQVKIATRGDKAIEIATGNESPDLILLDIVMPGMDGYAVCKHLKENPRTRNIPIIFITSKDEVEDETHGLELGAVDYITKPFSIPIVKARIRTHLQLKQRTDLLEQLAAIDALTGLPNRRQFDETLTREWCRAMRSNQELSMILIDIDYFKKFNDNYGHLAGDDCLRIVAATLSEKVKRAGDFLARYGGEEFGVILSHTNQKGAAHLAENLRQSVQDLVITHSFGGPTKTVTLSLGIATVKPEISMTPAELIAQADTQLYKAKEDGRNRVCQSETGQPSS